MAPTSPASDSTPSRSTRRRPTSSWTVRSDERPIHQLRPRAVHRACRGERPRSTTSTSPCRSPTPTTPARHGHGHRRVLRCAAHDPDTGSKTFAIGKAEPDDHVRHAGSARTYGDAPVRGHRHGQLRPGGHLLAPPGICSVTSGGAITIVGVGPCTIAARQAGNATYNPAPAEPRASPSRQATRRSPSAPWRPRPWPTRRSPWAPRPPRAWPSASARRRRSCAPSRARASRSRPPAPAPSPPTRPATRTGTPPRRCSRASPSARQPRPTRRSPSRPSPTCASTRRPRSRRGHGQLGLSRRHLRTAASAGICSVTSGGVITLVGVGLCTIAADQAGNATYNPAPQQSQSFTITPGDQTITFGALAARPWPTRRSRSAPRPLRPDRHLQLDDAAHVHRRGHDRHARWPPAPAPSPPTRPATRTTTRRPRCSRASRIAQDRPDDHLPRPRRRALRPTRRSRSAPRPARAWRSPSTASAGICSVTSGRRHARRRGHLHDRRRPGRQRDLPGRLRRLPSPSRSPVPGT